MAKKKSYKIYWIAGSIAVVSILGALAYLQYKRLMDYCMSFRAVKVNRFSLNNLNFDVWLNFVNKSNVNFTIVSQTTKVYLNDRFVTTVSNKSPNIVRAKQSNVLGVNVNIDPKRVFQNIGISVFDMLKDVNKIRVKMDMKIRVKLYGITVPVPYVYEDTLAGMMGTDGEQENKSTENKESEC